MVDLMSNYTILDGSPLFGDGSPLGEVLASLRRGIENSPAALEYTWTLAGFQYSTSLADTLEWVTFRVGDLTYIITSAKEVQGKTDPELEINVRRKDTWTTTQS